MMPTPGCRSLTVLPLARVCPGFFCDVVDNNSGILFNQDCDVSFRGNLGRAVAMPNFWATDGGGIAEHSERR